MSVRKDYDDFREKQAGISRARSAGGREIGEIPPILDIERRESCRTSLRLFCETYNPEPFYFGFSDDHLKAIARIEEAATLGAMFAFAMPRGSGKSTICRMAALWSVSYALRRYVFCIGANADKAEDALAAIKTYIRFLPNYAADFPEIAHAARGLEGIANRASGQTCGGEPTMIEWGKDRIILPTVPPPPNWPKAWPTRPDGMAPTSGSVVSASGLTGDGIRGSNLTLTTGEALRPDLVLIDDPQTHESAHSDTQNDTRTTLISADVLGMAGPGRKLSAVMPCTVIARGDCIDTILDRSKHPLWRGERTKLMRSMPSNMADWDDYFEVYQRCAQLEPPDFTESNGYYVAHRETLDAGADASWEDRKNSDEVSATQSAMHLYFRDRQTFFAEYQNDPEPEGPSSAARALDPEKVARRVTNVPRFVVPRGCGRVTAFIDVGAHLIWYAVVAWDERFGGSVIDYGCYPDQRRAFFSSADPKPGLGDLPEFKGQSQNVAVYGGLTAAADRVFGRSFVQEETGAEFHVERAFVDANWGPGTELVYEFCRRSPHAKQLVASHGKFFGASSNSIDSWQLKPGNRAGKGWHYFGPGTGKGRHVVFDSNHWKSFVSERLRSPEGAAGSLRLFAPGPAGHQLIAAHCGAEYPVAVSRPGGKTVDEWKEKPGKDNHWFDCLVGAALVASFQGLAWSAAAASGQPTPLKAPAKRVKLSDIQRAKQAARG